MKEKCSFVRKVALCLMSVAAMGVQAAHITVDVPRHTTSEAELTPWAGSAAG